TQTFEIERIGVGTDQLHQDLENVVKDLPINQNLRVTGDYEDIKCDLENLMENMQYLDKYLEAFKKNPKDRQQSDNFVELAIQIQRGFEHYKRNVALGNFSPNHNFEIEITLRQLKIQSTVSQLELPESFCWCNFESWILSSRDVIFDAYNESRLLGRGGFGTVYKGTYQGQSVAVKQINEIIMADSADFEAVVAKEIKHWNTISKHPYILTLYGVCTKAMKPIVVSELCQTNIRRYVRDWPEMLIPMIYQFALGLTTLHDANIIHRDIKGDNILVTFRGTVAIADFGLSRQALSLENTATGAREIGTLNWMSPEQYFSSRKVTVKSDVWSFGMTLWEILRNDIPFRGCTEEEFKNEIFPSETDRPEVPEEVDPSRLHLWELIKLCWQVDPGTRPSSSEIVEYLNTHYNTELEGL
ncbi:unnamed protein product, partial [Aphanomyces euteiches]